MAKEDLALATTKVKAVVTALNTKPINLGQTVVDTVGGLDKVVDYLLYVSVEFSQYKAVDLGLPSGTKWCGCNVGAATPEDYGEFFAWGATVGTKNGQSADYSEYPSSYNSTYGYPRSGTLPSTLPADKDAATVNMGAPWRMPTREEFVELKTNTTYHWTTEFGVYGRLFTSKINGATLFFPAAGYRTKLSVSSVSSIGCYWSSSLGTSDYAYQLKVDSNGISTDTTNRYLGFSVRAVQ